MPFHVVIPALIWGVWVMHPVCNFSSIDIIFPMVTMVNESSIIINVDEWLPVLAFLLTTS